MENKNLRILGIDPGTATVGWAVLEVENGKPIPLQYGDISTPAGTPLPDRIHEICTDIEQIIDLYKPHETSIEKIFFFKNLKTAIDVSQARGAMLLTLKRKCLTIAEYTPLQIKQSLTGYGRAEKQQIQQMVKTVLSLKTIPKPDDAADALAIALCHMNSRKIENLIK